MKLNRIILILTIITAGLLLFIMPAGATMFYDDFDDMTNWNEQGWVAGVGWASNQNYVTVSGGVASINYNSAYKLTSTFAPYAPPFTISYDVYRTSGAEEYFEMWGTNPLAANSYLYVAPGNVQSYTVLNGGTINDGDNVPAGQWVHVKINVYNDNTLEIFNDGVKKITSTYTIPGGAPFVQFANINVESQDIKFRNFYMSTDVTSDHTDLVEFNCANTTIGKNAGTYTAIVNRAVPTNNTVTVQYYTADGTALDNIDYDHISGTITFNSGSITQNLPSITIYNTDLTNTKTFTLHLSNVVNGTLGNNQTINVTITKTGDYTITVAPDPVTLFTNATATLNINDPDYRYDDIQWFMNGIQIEEYKLSGASQWQHWNGSAWGNCANATVFTQSRYQDTAGEHAFQTFINYQNARIGFAEGDFTVVNNETQTIYYIRVVDSEGADLSTFNGHFFESEDPSKDYTFTESGYGPVLDMHRHFQGIVNATGYINGTIAFQTNLDRLNTSATQRTITITMVGSDEPSDSSKAYLDVKIIDSVTKEPIPDAIFVLAYASNGSSKSYNLYGTVKRITVDKGEAYTYKASSSSYYAYTGSVTLNNGQGMLVIPLQPRPIATTVPTTPGNGGSGGTATYTPYTDTQRQNQAMTMIDQLLEAGPGLMQLVILAVFMGLIMMIFPNQSSGRKRYR